MSTLPSTFKSALPPLCFQQLNFALPRLPMKIPDYHYTGALTCNRYHLLLVITAALPACLIPGTVSSM